MAKTELKGTKQMADKLRRISRKYSGDVIGNGLFVIGEGIMRISKRDFVPVDLGALRSSGHVRPPERGAGRLVTVALVYGGPSAPYAIVQHENLDFRHKVGEAEYLRKPLMAAVPRIPRLLASLLDVERNC